MPETLKCPLCSNNGFRIEWKYEGRGDEVKHKYTGICANCGNKLPLGVG